MNIRQLCQIYHTVLGTTDSFYTNVFMTLQQSIKYQNKLLQPTRLIWLNWRVRHLISETKILVPLRISPGWAHSLFLFLFFINGSNFPCWRLWQISFWPFYNLQQISNVSFLLKFVWRFDTHRIFVEFVRQYRIWVARHMAHWIYVDVRRYGTLNICSICTAI